MQAVQLCFFDQITSTACCEPGPGSTTSAGLEAEAHAACVACVTTAWFHVSPDAQASALAWLQAAFRSELHVLCVHPRPWARILCQFHAVLSCICVLSKAPAGMLCCFKLAVLRFVRHY